MNEPNWKAIKSIQVPASPSGIWTLALAYVPAKTTLRFDSSGTWQYSDEPQLTCGPDGVPSTAVDATTGLLLAEAPVGAVIGKLGGSSSGKKDRQEIFTVGAFAVFDTGEKAGPLFLTINADPSRFPRNQSKLDVKISEMAP